MEQYFSARLKRLSEHLFPSLAQNHGKRLKYTKNLHSFDKIVKRKANTQTYHSNYVCQHFQLLSFISFKQKI